MKTIGVKDLMVPLEDYVTISEGATLFEAVAALEKARDEIDRTRYQDLHRALLVTDKNNRVVGKIGMLDMLKALEPRYAELGRPGEAVPVRFQRTIPPVHAGPCVSVGKPPQGSLF